MDADKLMDGLTNELVDAVRKMNKAKTVEEKLIYSKIIRNLTKSFAVFLDFANQMMDCEEDVEQ
ncbi:MAG: hypothetical protein M0Z90_01700 [Desulfobacteraceae bacterium]|nr:hypothetical protein [Desulfobacteraceae bacterium]